MSQYNIGLSRPAVSSPAALEKQTSCRQRTLAENVTRISPILRGRLQPLVMLHRLLENPLLLPPPSILPSTQSITTVVQPPLSVNVFLSVISVRNCQTDHLLWSDAFVQTRNQPRGRPHVHFPVESVLVTNTLEMSQYNIELSRPAASSPAALERQTSCRQRSPADHLIRISTIPRGRLQRFVMTYMHMAQAGGRLSNPPPFTVSRKLPTTMHPHSREA